MMKHFGLGLLLATVSLAPMAPAHAGPTITVSGVSVTGDAVTITGPISPVSTTAGPITLTSTIGTLYAWCVDIYHDVYTGTGQSLSYQIGTVTTNNAPTPVALTTAQENTIGQLAEYGQSLIGTAAATNDALAAVQLAIWQTEYSNFTYTGASGASTANALSAAKSFTVADAGLLALNGTQTFVTASPQAMAAIAAVPEPASLLLLAGAIPAVAAVRRRRRQAA